jgi:hypothetical protein
MGELEAVARQLKAYSRRQTNYHMVVENLKKDQQLTLENQLRMAQAESPDYFLVLLRALTERRQLSRAEVRSFIDSKSGAITSVALRNSLRLVPSAFLDLRKRSKPQEVSAFGLRQSVKGG